MTPPNDPGDSHGSGLKMWKLIPRLGMEPFLCKGSYTFKTACTTHPEGLQSALLSLILVVLPGLTQGRGPSKYRHVLGPSSLVLNDEFFVLFVKYFNQQS